MTQDMTQNFYASNTQLIFNNKDVNDHSYFNAETSNRSLLNIHEEATQIVENPLHLADTQIVDNTQSQFESCVVVEERVDDIHDAATQVSYRASPLTLQYFAVLYICTIIKYNCS